MGTRSLTYITADGENLICMYKQSDGSPAGYGGELATFLRGRKMVEGLPLSNCHKKVANGMSDLAAQLIAQFKKGVGEVYLENPAEENPDHGQEFVYLIDEKLVTVKDEDGWTLFCGEWYGDDFLHFCISNK